MKQSNLLFLAVASVLAAGVAIAAPATSTHAHAKLDVNGDGFIDRTEAAVRPGFAQRFDELDANHDGRIDASERPKHGMHGGHGMKKLDVNGDGVIDRAEAAKVPGFAQRFDRLDANHDGRIDASERPKHGMRDGKGGHGGMARLDADKDGRLSRAEAANSPMAKRFDQLDTNKDGFVDREEGRQAMQRWRAEHGKGGAAQNGVGSGGTGRH